MSSGPTSYTNTFGRLVYVMLALIEPFVFLGGLVAFRVEY